MGKKDVNAKDGKELDWMIARILLDNPKYSQERVADKVKREVGVVKRRMESMRDRGILEWGLIVEKWDEIGLPLRFRIDIEIDQKALLDVAGGGPSGHIGKHLWTQESLAIFIRKDLVDYVVKLPDLEPYLHDLKDQVYIEDVIILLGNPNADLSVILRARSNAALLKFVTGGLRMMKAVARTSTYQEAWSHRWDARNDIVRAAAM